LKNHTLRVITNYWPQERISHRNHKKSWKNKHPRINLHQEEARNSQVSQDFVMHPIR
jgi:hypothetical protein